MLDHPLADIFPLLEGTEFDDLVADIKANGLHEPIVVYEDKILDGRNRYRACMAAGVEPTFTAYTGDNPIAFVISLNLKRRHLNESQRAMVAAKLATLKRGDNQHSPIGETSQAKAAELLNVGKRSVERAAEVRDRGTPELVSAVEHGVVSVSAAAVIAGQSIEEQRRILAQVEPRLIVKEAQKINARKAEKRHAGRIAKLIEQSKGNKPLNLERAYPVILADPPWQFRQGISSPIRDTENHYPTMTTEAICALPVANLTTPDAVVFLWTTAAHLPEALRVMTAWGFEYQTNIVWVKDYIGPGYWVRSRHELLLIGSRGNMPHPAPSARPDSVITANRRAHSQKPDEAYELIEQMYPAELPKIELFARHARQGWDAWGNEVQPPNSLLEASYRGTPPQSFQLLCAPQRRNEMGIEVKDGKMINTCDWPDCGCREVVKWRYDKGWMSFMGADEEMREIIGLPDGGMLCLHHQEALEAYEDGDWERFLLLTSI